MVNLVDIAALDIRWAEGLSVGHPGLDAEHRCFIELLGRLGRTIGDRNQWADTLDITLAITTATAVHFAHEEQILHHYGYPASAAHAEEHRALIVPISELCAATVRSLTYEARAERVIELAHGLFSHLIGCDMHFKSFLTDALEGERRLRRGGAGRDQTV